MKTNTSSWAHHVLRQPVVPGRCFYAASAMVIYRAVLFSSLSLSRKGIIAKRLAHRYQKLMLALLMLSSLLFALINLGHGVWLPIKAKLAQGLIASAWQEALVSHQPVKPWAWSDTWPVARLQWQSSVDLYVLQGAGGNALAFGPGHMAGTAKPGSLGTSIIAGHRDTHFQFLQFVAVGDVLTIIDNDGVVTAFRVIELDVVNSKTDTVYLEQNETQLLLVTCYPFNAVDADGPLRYIVRAQATGYVV